MSQIGLFKYVKPQRSLQSSGYGVGHLSTMKLARLATKLATKLAMKLVRNELVAISRGQRYNIRGFHREVLVCHL